MINKLAYIFLLFSALAFSQERKPLQGKIISGDMALPGVFVINSKTGEEVKTDTKGMFNILAKPGDRLAVYSDRTEVREFAVTEKTFAEVPYEMSVSFKAYELKEVEIDKYNHINSEALGLVPKDQRRYTHMERKLYTAGDFKPIMLLGIIGGGLPIDPIINAINGKTKMLKKAVVTERKELLIQKINGIYTSDEIVSGYNIPEEYVDGFVFYIVEDRDFAQAMKEKNHDQAKFLMAALAEKYLKLIKNE